MNRGARVWDKRRRDERLAGSMPPQRFDTLAHGLFATAAFAQTRLMPGYLMLQVAEFT